MHFKVHSTKQILDITTRGTMIYLVKSYFKSETEEVLVYD